MKTVIFSCDLLQLKFWYSLILTLNYNYNIFLLAPSIIPIYHAQLVKGRFALLSSKALDKTLYKSVSFLSFQKINIIGGSGLRLQRRLLTVNAGILDFVEERLQRGVNV
jgi:hypothetical protein